MVLLILSCNGLYIILLIGGSSCHYQITAFNFLLHTKVTLMEQFLAPYFSPCACLPLLIYTLRGTFHSLMTYNYRFSGVCPSVKVSELVHTMQSYVGNIKDLATSKIPQHDDNRREPMHITSRRHRHLHNLLQSMSVIPFKLSMKNLGLTLDCHITTNEHFSTIDRTCYFELRSVASIRI